MERSVEGPDRCKGHRNRGSTAEPDFVPLSAPCPVPGAGGQPDRVTMDRQFGEGEARQVILTIIPTPCAPHVSRARFRAQGHSVGLYPGLSSDFQRPAGSVNGSSCLTMVGTCPSRRVLRNCLLSGSLADDRLVAEATVRKPSCGALEQIWPAQSRGLRDCRGRKRAGLEPKSAWAGGA